MAKLYINDEVLELKKGETLFTHADQSPETQKAIASSCGRNGTCRECIIQIKSGSESLSPLTDKENFLKVSSLDTNSGIFRLACQALVIDDSHDISCETFKRSLQIVQKGIEYPVTLDPLTHVNEGKVYWGEDYLEEYQGGIYGLAMDLGTTTVVLSLYNLETGELVQTTSFENPQKYGGSDVLHRISYDNDPEKRGRLHETIKSFVNKEIRSFPVKRKQIYEFVIAGNATMRDIFFNLPVETIGVSPYKSITQFEYEEDKRNSTSLLMEAHELGIQINPHARIYGIPLIGCHVGADTAAATLTLDILKRDKPVMMIDIGTNTEVVLGNKDRVIAASCPAGPSFEGGKIKFGMPGVEGAIERVRIKGDKLEYHVIGDITPHGICGSGLIDLIAELVHSGQMDELGRFQNGNNEYTVVPERNITFSRADLSELAQAKAANIAGQKILLREYGINLENVDAFYLAGGFAWYIEPANARSIGLIPPFPDDKIIKSGNASLEGARAVLLNRGKRDEIEKMVRKIEHIELEQEEDFFDLFVEGTQFKPMKF
jgi:uncharacterized 2Fe-2S/4Fe-4S cluster protein (DUF4445 family)